MLVCKNLVSIDLRVLSECLPKINRYRTTPFLTALYKSIMADSLHPELMDEHDNYFKPNTQPEKDLWTSCRELAKKEMKSLIKSVKGGQEGGRPKKLTPEEKQETLQKAIRSVGVVGKNEVIITPNFELPHDEYFDSYRKTYSADELKRVVDWLKKTKLNEKVDYMWIGKQIQNFKKRNTGKIF